MLNNRKSIRYLFNMNFVLYLLSFIIVILAVFSNLLYPFDMFFLTIFNELSINYPLFTRFFMIITIAGSLWFWIIVTFLFGLYFIKNNEKSNASLILFALIFSTLLVLLFKELIMRPRPQEILLFNNIGSISRSYWGIDLRYSNLINSVLNSSKFSFPSGHSTRTITMFKLFSSIFKKYRYFFLIISILILFSRLFLGVHYPLDLLGGLILGLISAHFSLFFIKLLNNEFQ